MADYDEEYMAQVEAIRAARRLKAAKPVPEPVEEVEEEEVEPSPSVIAMPKDGGGANPS